MICQQVIIHVLPDVTPRRMLGKHVDIDMKELIAGLFVGISVRLCSLI